MKPFESLKPDDKLYIVYNLDGPCVREFIVTEYDKTDECFVCIDPQQELHDSYVTPENYGKTIFNNEKDANETCARVKEICVGMDMEYSTAKTVLRLLCADEQYVKTISALSRLQNVDSDALHDFQRMGEEQKKNLTILLAKMNKDLSALSHRNLGIM